MKKKKLFKQLFLQKKIVSLFLKNYIYIIIGFALLQKKIPKNILLQENIEKTKTLETKKFSSFIQIQKPETPAFLKRFLFFLNYHFFIIIEQRILQLINYSPKKFSNFFFFELFYI